MTEPSLQRRNVLKTLALAGGAFLAPAGHSAASQGEFNWAKVRASFPRQTPFLNLDNGCISPPPISVQESAIKAYRFANQNPCYNMFEVLDGAVPGIKKKLAAIADCDPDEIALNRCTTVGMCTAIFGMPLSRGDEVVLSSWDYPSMISAWKQRAAREGLELKFASFGLMDSDEAIFNAYLRAVTPRTKAMQLTHMIHWSGRVLPVERICKFASERRIVTVVDAAQSFAHIPLSFSEMGCDYLATSFHKWLSAPIGTGMFIVKAERIAETWPLYATFEELKGADKFSLANAGTYNNADHYAISDAIDFHNKIGSARKHARLQELSKYWVGKASGIPGFRIHSLMDHPKLGGLTTFSLDGIAVQALEQRLREEFKIQTRKRTPQGFSGIRVTPQVYNTTAELDEFVAALRQIARSA